MTLLINWLTGDEEVSEGHKMGTVTVGRSV
jgi:hypothetical protein